MRRIATTPFLIVIEFPYARECGGSLGSSDDAVIAASRPRRAGELHALHPFNKVGTHPHGGARRRSLRAAVLSWPPLVLHPWPKLTPTTLAPPRIPGLPRRQARPSLLMPEPPGHGTNRMTYALAAPVNPSRNQPPARHSRVAGRTPVRRSG